jgi:hypothetical protein
VLANRVRLTGGTQAAEAVAGHLLTAPAEADTLDAVEDSALLLTVAHARIARVARLGARCRPWLLLAGGLGVVMQQRTEPEPGAARARISLRIPMTARTVDEPHRAATQLELLFDLTFVVAVAAVAVAVATQLGHGVAEGMRRRSWGRSCWCSSPSGGPG